MENKLVCIITRILFGIKMDIEYLLYKKNLEILIFGVFTKITDSISLLFL